MESLQIREVMNMAEIHFFLVFQHLFYETEVCLVFCRRNASSLFPLHPGCCVVMRHALSSLNILLSSPAWRTRLTAHTGKWQPALSAFQEESCLSLFVGWLLCEWSVWMVLWVSSTGIPLSAVSYNPSGWGKLWMRLKLSEADGFLHMERASQWQNKVEKRKEERGNSHWWIYLSQIITEISSLFYEFRCISVPSV